MGVRYWFGMAALQVNLTAVHIPLILFSLFYHHAEVSARQISLSSPLSSSLEMLHVSHTNTLPGPDNELDLTRTVSLLWPTGWVSMGVHSSVLINLTLTKMFSNTKQIIIHFSAPNVSRQNDYPKQGGTFIQWLNNQTFPTGHQIKLLVYGH